jgi:hypothetical protein
MPNFGDLPSCLEVMAIRARVQPEMLKDQKSLKNPAIAPTLGSLGTLWEV